MKLIDKDKIAAELEKRYEYWREKEFNSHSIESEIRMSECQHLMLLLNNLKAKEVNLEEEIKDYIYTLPHSRTGIPGGWKCSWSEEEVIKIVKHFLNLD